MDHMILVQRLQTSFGLSDVLSWFHFIWTSANRTSAIVANFQHRQWYNSACPRDRDSLLGPILFMLYTTGIVTVIERRGLSVHQYVLMTRKSTVAVILTTPHRSVASLVAACMLL